MDFFGGVHASIKVLTPKCEGRIRNHDGAETEVARCSCRCLHGIVGCYPD